MISKKMMLVLIASGMGIGMSHGAISTSYSNMGNMSASVGALTNSLTVAKGDVVVMVGATNKKRSANKLTFTSSAGAVTDLSADAQLGNDPNPNSYLSYITLGTAGTYDFICSFPAHYAMMKGKFIVE